MAKQKRTKNAPQNKKAEDLKQNTADGNNQFLTTNQGLRIQDNQNSLKAGERGATLLEDFILREKITHFDHERIPERIVHARGSGAHGVFEAYESMASLTKADFLSAPGKTTPVFVRFSTVAGSRGSTDLARDVRGFAVKFYTDEGVYDLVGNNIPVFFIQDAIKFPDLIHAVKPEPHNEIPQAGSAHDTFWDFVSLMPESMHMIMWAMSDRALPRSYRMMEGFGIHTFRFVNAAGESCFVKFHWKPMLGVHSVAWDEAQKISGKDADFHRRDLWEAIDQGDYPQWELGVQVIPEKDERKFDFDILDPTKLIPEEIVPVKIIGKMTLNRNPDNFFAETEQVAFHPGHIVPGIDFSNDPLLQGRLFSYTDTQLSRLGSPNFHEIPINRSVSPVNNNQRDGHMRQTINAGITSYDPNRTGGGYPVQATSAEGGFTSYHERIDARKVRARSKSFFDHFSQAALFYNSQSEPEQNHIINALRFELGKVNLPDVRERVVGFLTAINKKLAAEVAYGLGMEVPQLPEQPNFSVPADGDPADFQPLKKKQRIAASAALSMANTVKDTIVSRQVAVLLTEGVYAAELNKVKAALEKEGAKVKLIAPRLGNVGSAEGTSIAVDMSFLTAASVVFDAVYIPGGTAMDSLAAQPDAIHFVQEAYKHCKAIAWGKSAIAFMQATAIPFENGQDPALISLGDPKAFVAAIASHRYWERETANTVPA